MVASAKKKVDFPKGKVLTPVVGAGRNGMRPPRAGLGKPPNTPNKFTRILKELIMRAAERHGEDGKGLNGIEGYLYRVARDDMKSFVGLLGRVLPLQLNLTEGPLVLEAEKVREHLSHLSGDELAVLESVYNDPKLIDITPEKEDV